MDAKGLHANKGGYESEGANRGKGDNAQR